MFFRNRTNTQCVNSRLQNVDVEGDARKESIATRFARCLLVDSITAITRCCIFLEEEQEEAIAMVDADEGKGSFSPPRASICTLSLSQYQQRRGKTSVLTKPMVCFAVFRYEYQCWPSIGAAQESHANPDSLDDLLRDFVDYCSKSGKLETTSKAYAGHIRRWLQHDNKSIEEILGAEFLAAVEKSPANTTRNRQPSRRRWCLYMSRHCRRRSRFRGSGLGRRHSWCWCRCASTRDARLRGVCGWCSRSGGRPR